MLYQKPPFGVLPPYTGVCRTVPVQLQYVACLCAGHSDGVQVQGRPDPFGGSEKPYTVGERPRGRSGVGGAAPATTRRCERRRALCAPSLTRTTTTSTTTTMGRSRRPREPPGCRCT